MRVVNSLLVIAILLFATVMTWTYFSVRGDQPSSLPQAGIGGGPNDTNYNAQFNALLVEHVNLTTIHLTNLYDGNETADTSRKLEDNAQKLADVMKQLGTPADRDAFLRTFRGHIDEYEIYTKGRKENQPLAMNTAKENLQMHAMDFGNLIHKLMPTISEERGTALMDEHEKLTLVIIDTHAEGDTAAKRNAIRNANAQAVTFAEALSNGAEETSK